MLTANPIKLKSGSWGIRVKGKAKKGDKARVQTKSGKTWETMVERVIWSGNGVSICADEPRRNRGAECPMCGDRDQDRHCTCDQCGTYID